MEIGLEGFSVEEGVERSSFDFEKLDEESASVPGAVLEISEARV